MPKNSAEYMREYRARKRAKLDEAADQLANNVDWPTAREMVQTITDLREEVARLKRELAQRPTTATVTVRPTVTIGPQGRWVPEYRPVPKLGKRK